jgi:hypothetical protein
MIPVISALLAKAQAATDPLERARHLARCAMYWALAGDGRSAGETIRALRADPAALADAELAAWIWLTEGLGELGSNQNERSLDRFKRAHVLASCLAGREIAPLSAAWLAHVEFNFGDPLRLCPLAVEALRGCSPGMAAALARVAVSLGDAHLYADDEDAAKAWYAHARHAAEALKDTTTLASAAHNMASVAVRSLRLNRRLGTPMPALATIASTLSDSSRNLDELAGIRFLPHYEPWVRLQLAMAEGDFRRAGELIAHHIARWEASGPRRYLVQARADALQCRAAAGKPVDPAAADEVVRDVERGGFDADDRALAYLSLSDLFGALGERGRAAKLLDAARAAFAEHGTVAAAWRARLSGNNLGPQPWNHLYGTA